MSSSYLKPINEKHSIKEAVFCIFLASPIPNPNRFKDLLKNGLNEFQSFNPLLRYDFNMNLATKGSNLNTTSDVGFDMIHSEFGDKVFVIRGHNNDDLRNYFSFHALKYSKWEEFKNSILNYIQKISNFQPGLQISAFSLLYVDEFDWEPDFIKLNQIFNGKSKILSKDFFDSLNSNLSLTLEKKSDVSFYQDRLDLNVSSVTKKIVISNNIGCNLEKVIDLDNISDENNNILSQINYFHTCNKKNLEDLLSDDVSKQIGLIK